MNPLLQIQDLCIDVGQGASRRRVVHDVSLRLSPGECLGIAGESGSGKSLTMRSVIGLLPRGAQVTGGTHLLDGAEYLPQRVRGHGLAMVFQEPMTALNPTRRVGDIVADGVLAGRSDVTKRRHARDAAIELMRDVGIPDPARRSRSYAHELSGGLRQRVMIALALSGNPRLLICDEPTTALDATVQDQILGLLDRLRIERNLSMLFVTHDLGVISQISQTVAVMHDGRVVEQGVTSEVLAQPQHAYTAGLCAAAAALEGRRTTRKVT